LFVCDLGGGDDTIHNKLRMDFLQLGLHGGGFANLIVSKKNQDV
jgi:hypothetical protein